MSVSFIVKRRIALALVSLSALLVVVAFGAATVEAKADTVLPPGTHCQTTNGIWIFKGNTRDICDTPRNADGSWTRYREFYTPEHWVNARSSCYGSYGYRSCTYTPGYWQPFTSNGVEVYPVSDAPGAPNPPLWDEPGWIAA